MLCNFDMYFCSHLIQKLPVIKKNLQYYVKTCFQRCFEFFKKNLFIKERVKQLKNKECKKPWKKP